jgi:hypothetical protein
MDHTTEYTRFCSYVVRSKVSDQSSHELFRKVEGLNGAIIELAQLQKPEDHGLKLQSLEMNAKAVRQIMAEKPHLRPSRQPECLGIFSKALIQADLATTIARQCATTALRFPVL